MRSAILYNVYTLFHILSIGRYTNEIDYGFLQVGITICFKPGLFLENETSTQPSSRVSMKNLISIH